MQYCCAHCLSVLELIDDVISVCACHPDGAVEWIVFTDTQQNEGQASEFQ